MEILSASGSRHAAAQNRATRADGPTLPDPDRLLVSPVLLLYDDAMARFV
jgi:hypothetical protein